VGEKVSYEGMVTKLSGGKMFGGNKWDSRTLRLENRELIYLDKGKEKGRVPLDGSSVAFVEEDEYPGHPHAFAVQVCVFDNCAFDVYDGCMLRSCLRRARLLFLSLPLSEKNICGYHS
jgi:hypothetical protein